jgi:hypothetical protein
MFRGFANYKKLSASANYFAVFAHLFNTCSYFHLIELILDTDCLDTYIALRISGKANYRSLRMIRPLVRSYGVTSTITLSPGKTRILLTLSFPAICARIICPESIWIRNKALGKFSRTLPSSSITSLLLSDFPKS